MGCFSQWRPHYILNQLATQEIKRQMHWNCYIVKHYSCTLLSPHLPLIIIITALIPLLWPQIIQFHWFHRACWIVKVPIITRVPMSQNIETQTWSLLSRYYEWRGAAATASDLTFKSPSLYALRVCTPPKEEEKILDYTTNKDSHIASMTRLMKNDSVLFYSLGSLFCKS